MVADMFFPESDGQIIRELCIYCEYVDPVCFHTERSRIDQDENVVWKQAREAFDVRSRSGTRVNHYACLLQWVSLRVCM